MKKHAFLRKGGTKRLKFVLGPPKLHCPVQLNGRGFTMTKCKHWSVIKLVRSHFKNCPVVQNEKIFRCSWKKGTVSAIGNQFRFRGKYDISSCNILRTQPLQQTIVSYTFKYIIKNISQYVIWLTTGATKREANDSPLMIIRWRQYLS